MLNYKTKERNQKTYKWRNSDKAEHLFPHSKTK